MIECADQELPPKEPTHRLHLAATYRRNAGVFQSLQSARYTNNAQFRRYPQTEADPLRVRDRSITRLGAAPLKSRASFAPFRTMPHCKCVVLYSQRRASRMPSEFWMAQRLDGQSSPLVDIRCIC